MSLWKFDGVNKLSSKLDKMETKSIVTDLCIE